MSAATARYLQVSANWGFTDMCMQQGTHTRQISAPSQIRTCRMHVFTASHARMSALTIATPAGGGRDRNRAAAEPDEARSAPLAAGAAEPQAAESVPGIVGRAAPCKCRILPRRRSARELRRSFGNLGQVPFTCGAGHILVPHTEARPGRRRQMGTRLARHAHRYSHGDAAEWLAPPDCTGTGTCGQKRATRKLD